MVSTQNVVIAMIVLFILGVVLLLIAAAINGWLERAQHTHHFVTVKVNPPVSGDEGYLDQQCTICGEKRMIEW